MNELITWSMKCITYVFFILYNTTVIAASAPQSITVNIKGRILEPAPCTISGTGENGLISVDFGDEVMITRLDGVYYKKPINYSINCSSQYMNAMMLRVVGASTGFGNGFLQSTVSDLGIALTVDSKNYPINTFINFNYPELPIIDAAPIKKPGSVLKGQPFTATAIMQVYYQ